MMPAVAKARPLRRSRPGRRRSRAPRRTYRRGGGPAQTEREPRHERDGAERHQHGEQDVRGVQSFFTIGANRRGESPPPLRPRAGACQARKLRRAGHPRRSPQPAPLSAPRCCAPGSCACRRLAIQSARRGRRRDRGWRAAGFLLAVDVIDVLPLSGADASFAFLSMSSRSPKSSASAGMPSRRPARHARW